MQRTEWYKNAVIYQIYPFSFKDANNDGWGDIEGIISKLDYLKELGITAIWFSPLYRSPDFDYGYDISDYRDIDPKFGDINDFKRMVSMCHEKGIRVIMDIAINHASVEHEWFKKAIEDTESPYRDYFIIRKGRHKGKKLLPPTNWDSTFTGPAWENIKGTEDFYLHLFCVEQADLNWENPRLRNEAAEIFNYWFEMGVDGFRLDVFNMFSKVYPLRDAKKKIAGTGSEYYIDGPRMHEYLKELNTRCFSKYDSYTVGESYKPHEEDARAYVDAENHELDTIFNFAHLDSDNMVKFIQTGFKLKKFKEGLFGPQIQNYGKGWNTLVLENHDNPRSNSRFGIDTVRYHYEASTMLPALTFLGFGTPFIYMGEEFGMTNVVFSSPDECMDPVTHFIYNMFRKFRLPKRFAMKCVNFGARDMARVPMRWDGSVNNGFNEGCEPWQKACRPLVDVSYAEDIKKEKSVFKFYRKVIELKKTEKAAIYGSITEFDRENKNVAAYLREYEGESLFVCANFSAKTVQYKIPADVHKKNGKIILSNYDRTCITEKVKLSPYEVMVVKA